jgi:hypothetical protein
VNAKNASPSSLTAAKIKTAGATMILFPALLGLTLCLLNAAGAGLFCLTSGCALYAGYSLFGLSFYVYGTIAFGVIVLLAASARKIPRAAPWLGGIILLGLVLDLFFLGWQLLYWPCSSCLAIALLLGWTATAFWRTYPQLCRRLFKGVLLAWLVLLIPAVIAAGKEVLLTPWALYGPTDANIRVFFSPTCPACVTEVNKLLQSSDVARMAFYPIAKNDRDLRFLAALLQEGIAQPADLGRLFAADLAEAQAPSLQLRWHLAKNKMALASLGAQTIPLILSSTVIEGAKPPWAELFSPPDLTPAAESNGGCGIVDQQNVSCE